MSHDIILVAKQVVTCQRLLKVWQLLHDVQLFASRKIVAQQVFVKKASCCVTHTGCWNKGKLLLHTGLWKHERLLFKISCW